eukprot:s308_g6.t1
MCALLFIVISIQFLFLVDTPVDRDFIAATATQVPPAVRELQGNSERWRQRATNVGMDPEAAMVDAMFQDFKKKTLGKFSKHRDLTKEFPSVLLWSLTTHLVEGMEDVKSPLQVKLGGAFHVGVEVFGMEWSYGRTFRDSRPGVVGLPPRKDPNHTFRQTVQLGCTPLSMEAVTELITELIEDYPGRSYDVLRPGGG